MNGFQVTYWNDAGKPAPTPKPGTKVSIYKCQKCALIFDNPTQFRTNADHFKWCPCCQNTDFDYLGTAITGTPLADTAKSNGSDHDLETIVMLDLMSDGQLDGGFLSI